MLNVNDMVECVHTLYTALVSKATVVRDVLEHAQVGFFLQEAQLTNHLGNSILQEKGHK